MGTGAGVILIAESSLSCIFGATAEARRGLVGEKETLAAVKELAATLGTDACVDEWLQDQLIIFAALADGRSAMRYVIKPCTVESGCSDSRVIWTCHS